MRNSSKRTGEESSGTLHAHFGPGHLNGALSVSSGSYLFAERTTTWGLITALTVGSDRLRLRAALPFYLQNTSLVSGSGIGRVPTGGSSSGAVGDSGAARKGRRVLIGVDVAYWRLGDLPDLELRDPVSGAISLGYVASSGWGGSLVGSAATAVVEGFDGPASIGAALTWVSSGRSSWSLLSLVGLTETSPDVTVGLSWSVRLSH